MPTLAIRASYAPLLSLFVSTEETRYYLDGFYATPANAGGVEMVATDGHRLAVFHEEEGFIDGAAIWPLRNETLKACKPAVGDKKKIRWLVIEPADPTRPLGAHRASIVLVPLGGKHDTALSLASEQHPDWVPHIATIKPIDGTYPDYRRVLPAEIPTTTVTAWFNNRYLQDFFKVAESAGPAKTGICIHNVEPHAPAIILTARTDFIGALMPIRSIADAGKWPAWWTAPKARPKKSAKKATRKPVKKADTAKKPQSRGKDA